MMKRDPEVFLPMKEFDGAYHISNYGNVKSFTQDTWEGRLIRPKKTKSGYLQYIIKYKNRYCSFYAHRRVAQYFVPNPYGLPFTDHKNNVKADNYYGNLQWMTSQDNVRKDQADIIICKHETGRVLEVLGTREAAAVTSCIRGSVQYSLKNGTKTRNGWSFQYKNQK